MKLILHMDVQKVDCGEYSGTKYSDTIKIDISVKDFDKLMQMYGDADCLEIVGIEKKPK